MAEATKELIDTGISEKILAETKATPSEEEDTEDDDEIDVLFDGDDEDDMPLMYYTRLPRNSETVATAACTCSAIGKMLLNAETTSVEAGDSIHVWQSAPIFLTCVGYDNGCIQVVDSRGNIIIPSDDLKIREANSTIPVVAVSWDASGTILGALDSQGACAVWEIRYQIEMRQRSQLSVPSTRPSPAGSSAVLSNSPNVFRNFMSVLTTGSTTTGRMPNSPDGMGSRNSSTHGLSANSRHGNSATAQGYLPVLTTSSLQVARSTYPKSFGAPTCLAVDPAYRQRREKNIIVGFSGGHLVLTKRGTILFQRRNDTILYQSDSTDKSFQGIETLTWRGSLIAWADTSGIKVMETDAWTRLASIDRPAGARPSLYPTLTGIHPHMVFETSDRLLVAWGDCLLALVIRERRVPASTAAMAVSQVGSPVSAMGAPVTIRKVVELCMAWELDCVACGVAPMDDEHIAILGFVVPPESEVSNKNVLQSNSVEVHVLCRTDGQVTYSDLLPVERLPVKIGFRGTKQAESVRAVSLLSTYSVTRMDDAGENQAVQRSLNSSDRSTSSFVDSFKQWNLGMVAFDQEDFYQAVEDPNSESEDPEDSSSVDSDNYGFLFQPSRKDAREALGTPNTVSAPAMVISTGADLVAMRLRGMDDAIHDALESNRAGLALCRALADPRQLRRYSLDDLVDEYLKAVLRLPRATSTDDDQRRPLSLRRMKLASTAMPTLLGGNLEQWVRWLNKLEGIPGALFSVRNFVPVRDPKLPENVYTKILIRMYTDVTAVGSAAAADILENAEVYFLGSLLAWGTTNVLRNHIDYYKYQADIDSSNTAFLRIAEEGIKRRMEQTAANYLQFPVVPSSEDHESTNPVTSADTIAADKSDALFSCDELMMILCKRNGMDETHGDKDKPRRLTKCSLDAQARLCLMQGRLDEALKFFLTIGTRFATQKLEEIEEIAISATSGKSPVKERRESGYIFVLAIIETHHLHQSLLDRTFLKDDTEDEESTFPLFALVQLVGLELFGEFLMKHCIAPNESDGRAQAQMSRSGAPSDKTDGERRGTLPLDSVALQLEACPGLLHWYLHMILIHNPELYVKFPNTARPPTAIVELHRKALSLHIKFAGVNRDSAIVLKRIETYKAAEAKTPLLKFLESVIHIGGIRANEVGKLLERERKGGASSSGTFALELAYILENFGQETEAEARLVMDLYLRGARSLMLAVLCAQRSQEFSHTLWNVLVEHCLSSADPVGEPESGGDGSLLGSLLEAAALSGADLAVLVTQIPTGMSVEGLRPRLVAAVADYRMKLLLHKASSEVAATELMGLLRESAQRSRRGARYVPGANDALRTTPPNDRRQENALANNNSKRGIRRPNHQRRSLAIPIR